MLDIAIRPEHARASHDLLEILDTLYFALAGALAIVSGRRIEDIDRLFAPLRLPASGVHGAQLRRGPEAPILDRGAPDIPAAVAAAVATVAERHRSVMVEDKGKALAVHWRAAPACAPALLADLEATLAAFAAPPLSILRGHCVFEIKSPFPTKGDAVRDFMRAPPFAGRAPIFVGDETMFALTHPIAPVSGVDETFPSDLDSTARDFETRARPHSRPTALPRFA